MTREDKVITFCLIVIAFLAGVYLFPVLYLLLTGDFPGAKIFYGIQEDSSIVTFLLNLR